LISTSFALSVLGTVFAFIACFMFAKSPSYSKIAESKTFELGEK
jgi:hypothetical protein